MTELLTRSARSTPAPAAPLGRPLVVSATLAGIGSALGGLTVFLAVAVTGWFLADGGAHGDTKDAMRVGADAWLVGHGSHLTFGGVDYTLVPLGLTALLGWAAFRGGRWAGTTSPLSRDRELPLAIGLFCAGYVVVAVVTSVLAATAEVRGNLVLTLLGALALSALGGGAGLVCGADRWEAVTALLPPWAGPLLRTAAAAVLGLLTCAAVLVAVPLVLQAGASASLVSRLDLHGGDAVMLVLLSALLAPNAVLLGGAYLLGPGFSVGVGTTVSPGVVVLGPVPTFPLLSGLPDTGATPWWTTGLMVLPALAALVGVVLVQRHQPVLDWREGVLRGVGAGVLAGLVSGLLAALGGGAVGDGRMSDVGASLPAVVLAGAVTMGLGGLLGAIVTTALQRHGWLVGARDPAEEPTVATVLPRQLRADRPPPPASVREQEAADLLERLVRKPDWSSEDDDEDTIRLL